MNLLLIYLFVSFLGGMFLWRHSKAWSILLLLLLTLLISFAYVYLEKM